MATNKVGRLRELDALRGIAALFVMLFHYSVMSGADVLLLKLGVTGVDLFFLISGFVILMTLEKTKTARDFIISRLSRLYPSYITMLALTVTIIGVFNRASMPSFREVTLNLTMMQPVFKVGYIDDSYWTLTVELQFYIFMLIVFVSGRLKDIEWIGLVVLGVIAAFYFISYTYFPKSQLRVTPRSFFPLINHFQLFFSGIIFYKMKQEGMTIFRHLMLVAIFVFTLLIFDKTGRSHFYIGILPYATMVLVYLILFYFFVMERLKFLHASILLYFGAISYCLYLFHLEAGHVVFYYFTGKMGLPVSLVMGCLVAFVVAVASLVTFCIERPAIAWIRARTMKKN